MSKNQWNIVKDMREKDKTFLKRYFELFVILPFILLWIVMVLFAGMPVIKFGENGFGSGFLHYVFPLLFATVVHVIAMVLFRLLGKAKQGITLKETFVSLLYIPYICAVFFLHFNFKAWMPLVNSLSYDSIFYYLDNLTPLASFLELAANAFDKGSFFSELYFFIFFAMFMISFIFHSAMDTFLNFRKVVTGTCIILLLGGVLYWVMPAVGPFIFEKSKLLGFSEEQEGMYNMYLILKNTGIVPEGYFGLSLAAMPSLHTANSLYFLLCAKRSQPLLFVLYIPAFIFILIVAVASKYHYIVDLFFGAILAMFVYILMNKVFD
ncbi:MAG: phosphatase PAP2 family protein [Lachnospiraceae bacterium]|nr:phosphatase PAP2 family protein [Lachnospiraceae bacterium]